MVIQGILKLLFRQTLIGYFASKAGKQLFSDSEISSWALLLSCHLTFIPDFRLRFWLRRTWYVTLIKIKHRDQNTSVETMDLIFRVFLVEEHGRSLIHFFNFFLQRKPFLCECPEVAYHSVRQLLLVVIAELNKRLQSRWEQLAASECG